MRLTHYSATPFVFDPDRTYDDREAPGFKPDGLWLSVDGPQDWPAWVASAEWCVERVAHAARVVLRPTANVLVISTAAQLDAFTRAYPDASLDPHGIGWALDWPAVKAAHDAIIIAPYQWSRRLDHGAIWYYPWDCASGCVWNMRAVESVTPLPETQKKTCIPPGA